MGTPFHKLDEFLSQLDAACIHYRLNRIRDGYVMVELAVPGQRWEVEFSVTGDVEVEIFKSDGKILGDDHLEVLFRDFSDTT